MATKRRPRFDPKFFLAKIPGRTTPTHSDGHGDDGMRDRTVWRLRLDMREYPPDKPRGDRPAGAGEEADAEPDSDLVEVDGGGHVGFFLW